MGSNNKLKELCLYAIVPFIYIVGSPLVIAGIGSAVAYELHEKKEEVSIEDTNTDNIYTNSDGELCCKFDVGEHRIIISSDDKFYHKMEAVEGYEIQNVEINDSKNNNRVTYINKKPVVAKATGVNKDGKVEFANFGEVVKNKVKSIK